ncbi:transcriptional regulator, Crp/Fnr family [Ammonifex degensii KC4]|uniref:Transcriptional regulator, Crp/Fnr family n=1 Tax=Ammonifex degensii (strain DSM 10501 / KC4) TaxID=429009 RepID=C9R9Q5_AMMDK|nr:Crp/Fnr family transcriptional regulator [Ammonifex degensii]ACX53034.1 transcriptional regulator, Crp/Fnr family [Ammonifex degensii KC4]
MTQVLQNESTFRREPLYLNEKEKELLRSLGTTVSYPKGHILWAPEEIADRVYLLEKGWVKIYRLTANGREVTVGAIRNPGELIGLAEALYHGRRTCFAGAITDVTLTIVSKNDFVELLTENHLLALKVCKILAARMREAEALVHELVCWQVPGRLALLLLKMGESCGIRDEKGIHIELRLTHEELAGMIGTTRQTVTSLSNTFKKEGSIEMVGRKITICDPQKLASWVV